MPADALGLRGDWTSCYSGIIAHVSRDTFEPSRLADNRPAAAEPPTRAEYTLLSMRTDQVEPAIALLGGDASQRAYLYELAGAGWAYAALCPEGALVGCCVLHKDRRTLGALHVHAAHRRRGVARRLVSELCAAALDAEPSRALRAVIVEGNLASRRTFESLGFRTLPGVFHWAAHARVPRSARDL